MSWRNAATPRNAARTAVVLSCIAAAFVVALNATGGQRTLVAAGVNSLDYAPPDTVLYNGKISTEDAQDSTVEALAIRNGTVLATGTDSKVKALAGKSTRMIDLGGRRVLPGLLDGHLHGLRNAYHCFTNSPRLDNTFTRADAMQVFANKVKHVQPGQGSGSRAAGTRTSSPTSRGRSRSRSSTRRSRTTPSSSAPPASRAR